MKPPDRVCVGPHRYRVRFNTDAVAAASLEHGARLLGRCDTEACTIVVDPRLAGTMQRETLTHEVLHACMDVIGAGDDLGHDTEERVVRRLAPVLLDVLRRNPGLVSWLTR